MLQRAAIARRRHTAAAADPTPAIYDYAPKTRVMTCDGHPGVVLAVNDGPYPGTETYDVRLDGGMGGGSYHAGQLQPLPGAHTAGTAAADYPELGRVLAEHPDPARGTLIRAAAFIQTAADDLSPMSYCTACGKDGHPEKGCPAINGAHWLLRRMEGKAETNGHFMSSPTSHSDHGGSPWQLGLPFHHFRSYCYGCGADIKSHAGGQSGSKSPRLDRACPEPSLGQLEAARRRHTAAAEMSLGETIVPNHIPGPGPTKPHSPQDNPASSGWASAPDPDQWSSAPLYPLDSRVGARGPEACDTCGGHMFHSQRRGQCPHCGLGGTDYGAHHAECCPEAQPCDRCGQSLGEQAYGPCAVCGDNDPDHHAECCPHRRGGGGEDDDPGPEPDPGGVHAPRGRSEFGLAASLIEPEATLHEEPTGALPSTDGEINADDADPESLSPQSVTAILASFHAANPHMDPARAGGARSGAGDGDIASAAQAHLAGLSKQAAYDFTPGQRRALIEEGEAAGVRAANSDRMDLTGTHYADVGAAEVQDEESEGPWWT